MPQPQRAPPQKDEIKLPLLPLERTLATTGIFEHSRAPRSATSPGLFSGMFFVYYTEATQKKAYGAVENDQ